MPTDENRPDAATQARIDDAFRRNKAFAEKMESSPNVGYRVYDLREEAGFTARIAVKKPQPGKRGMVLICPGGGFRFKSWNEAFPVAEFFFEKGMNSAILDYHVNPYKEILGDTSAQRMAGKDGVAAVRWLRANAAMLGIDENRIAIGGFSAGGMLSGYAATKFDYGDPLSTDPLLRISSRPDAALILYGAFSTTSSIPTGTKRLSQEEFIAANELDNVRNIRTDCPPMFVFQTHADDPRIALNFCMELAVHGVPYEIHTFEEGNHGGALYNGKDGTPDVPHTALWAGIAADWLLTRGW